MPEAASLAMPEHRAPVTPEATMSPMPEYKAPVTTKDVIPAKPEYRRSSRERVKPDMKAPLDRTRSVKGFPAPDSALADDEFSVFYAPPPQRSVPRPGGFRYAQRPWAHRIIPGMARDMPPRPMPGRMPGRMPGMMPGMMPGRMPGMMPRMMPRFMRGMMPRIMPGMMPAVPAAMMPGHPLMSAMPVLEGMSAFSGMIPGISSMHPQSPVMMPTAEPAPAPCHVSPVTVLPQTTLSEPRIVTVPISGGGSGSQQPGLIPMPIPMPMPLPMPCPGGGGGGSQTPVIVTGTSPPSPQPPQHPYPYPQPCTHQCSSPQQPPPSNPLVETATISMMMQQIRFLLSPQRPMRTRRRTPMRSLRIASPLPSSAPAGIKQGDEEKVPDKVMGKKGGAKTAGKKKKKVKALGDDSSSSQASVDGRKERRESIITDKKEKEGGEKDKALQEQKKEDDKNDIAGSPPETQGGESLGKGPSSSAPPLSLNFPRYDSI
ncbi:uncharacterized protein LOC144097652 [Amblyomma americanum]